MFLKVLKELIGEFDCGELGVLLIVCVCSRILLFAGVVVCLVSALNPHARRVDDSFVFFYFLIYLCDSFNSLISL